MAKKKEQPETLRDYVQRSAKAKKTTPEIWWETTVQNIGSCRLATHVGKFTHPASTAALLVEPGDPDPGYVTTQACQVPEDLVAAALTRRNPRSIPPFIWMKSLTNRSRFCLFIEKKPVEAETAGPIGSYGLSDTRSVPDF